MFGVAIHIALKMAIKSNNVLKKTFTNFYKPQFQTGPTKNPEKDEKIATFWVEVLEELQNAAKGL